VCLSTSRAYIERAYMVTPSMLMPTHSLVDAYSKIDHSFPFFFFLNLEGRMLLYYTAIYIYIEMEKKIIYIELFTRTVLVN